MATVLAALPAYYIVTLGSHVYAQSLLAKSSNPRAYNNANPRAATNSAVFSKALGPQTYARYERARAAHANGLENFPLFAAAVLALRQVGAAESGVSTLAWANVALRLAYTVLFVNTESVRASYLRTLAWVAMTVLNVGALFRAAFSS